MASERATFWKGFGIGVAAFVATAALATALSSLLVRVGPIPSAVGLATLALGGGYFLAAPLGKRAVFGFIVGFFSIIAGIVLFVAACAILFLRALG